MKTSLQIMGGSSPWRRVSLNPIVLIKNEEIEIDLRESSSRVRLSLSRSPAE